MGSHEVTHLVHEYGCALVLIATALQALCLPVPGTTALAAAALYAGTSHGLPIVGVIAAAAGGALVGALGGFALGRWRGEQLLNWTARRLRQPPDRVARLRRAFTSHGAAWLFAGRFISGIRNVLGLLAGATGMPLARFVPLSAAAATVWALVNGLEYYWFGHAITGLSTWLQITLICLGIAWTLLSLHLLRRRAQRRAAVSAGELG